MKGHKYLIVVVGPTAVGKTATCIKLAQQFNTEIVSADSRQFYREMEIGTAKPDVEELSAAKHHFINSHTIEDEISAGAFEKMALNKLDELFETHERVIMTGGSGLYVNAVTDGMATMPKVEPEIRAALNERLKNEGLNALANELKEVDHTYYEKVDRQNPQRVIRALEIYEATGRPYSEFRHKSKVNRPFKTIKIGLNLPRDILYQRIEQRMDNMIANGLFEEAEKLLPHKNLNALQTVGYKEIFDYLDGAYDREEAIRLLKRNSRRYAKRQLTWFNKDETIKWFEPTNDDEIIAYIDQVT